MNVFEKVTELRKEFKETFGVDINVVLWAHVRENLTDREAKLIQSILQEQSKKELTPAFYDFSNQELSFVNYKLIGEGLEINLAVGR